MKPYTVLHAVWVLEPGRARPGRSARLKPENNGCGACWEPLDQERQEALTAALEGLMAAEAGEDRRAACRYLLRHLAAGDR